MIGMLQCKLQAWDWLKCVAFVVTGRCHGLRIVAVGV